MFVDFRIGIGLSVVQQTLKVKKSLKISMWVSHGNTQRNILKLCIAEDMQI